LLANLGLVELCKGANGNRVDMFEEKSLFYKSIMQIGLQELLESMGQSLQLGVMVTYPDGRPLTGTYNLCPFCAMLNRNRKARAMCEASREASVGLAVDAGEEVLYTCHAGLVYGAVPLKVAAETVAVVLIGNVTSRRLPKELVARVAVETGAEREKLSAAAQTVPIWTEKGLRTAMAAIKKVADTVVQLAYTKGKLERKVDELFALFELSQGVSGSLETGEVARRALQAVLRLSGATSGSVVMLGSEGDMGAEPEVAAALESSDGFRAIPPAEVVAAVSRETQAVQFDKSPEGSMPEERRAIALPLMVGDKARGVLSISGRREGPAFSEDEIAFLTTLCKSLGLALENARVGRELRAKVAVLDGLIELGRKISNSPEADVVIESVLGTVRDVLRVEWCALHLLDESVGELVLKGSIGLETDLQAKARRVRLEGSVMGKVLRTREPVVVDDLTRGAQKVDLPGYLAEMRAVAIVPILAGKKVLGALTICSRRARHWTEEHLKYLDIIVTQAGMALEKARVHLSLSEYYWTAVRSLAAALEAKDVYTRGHSLRVARWARTCAKMLGLSETEQEQAYLAGLLHDVGKIAVREDILLKNGTLNGKERKEIRSHPVVGATILEKARFPDPVIAAVRHHHEDYCGGGYPEGLMAEEIPPLARIMRVVDAYDAMTSARPYRRGLSARDAREELRRGSGQQFDPRVVEVFLRIPVEDLEDIGNGGGGYIYITRRPWRDTLFTETGIYGNRGSSRVGTQRSEVFVAQVQIDHRPVLKFRARTSSGKVTSPPCLNRKEQFLFGAVFSWSSGGRGKQK